MTRQTATTFTVRSRSRSPAAYATCVPSGDQHVTKAYVVEVGGAVRELALTAYDDEDAVVWSADGTRVAYGGDDGPVRDVAV